MKTTLPKMIKNPKKKSKKAIMKQIIDIKKEIKIIEKDFSPKNQYCFPGWSIIFLDNLRTLISKLYEIVFPEDSIDYPIIDFIEDIIDSEEKGIYKYFDTDLLSKSELDKYSKKTIKTKISINGNWIEFKDGEKEIGEGILLNWNIYKDNQHCFIKFKNIDEILTFVEKKKYFTF